MRALNRLSCSSSLTSSQNFKSLIPLSTISSRTAACCGMIQYLKLFFHKARSFRESPKLVALTLRVVTRCRSCRFFVLLVGFCSTFCRDRDLNVPRSDKL